MPFSLSPRVTNQNNSPGVTESSFPCNGGTLPVPFPSFPWHDRQLRSYSFSPASAAPAWPAYGFLAACAEAGALWNLVSTSAARSAAGSRIATAARASELVNERMNPPHFLGSYIRLWMDLGWAVVCEGKSALVQLAL